MYIGLLKKMLYAKDSTFPGIICFLIEQSAHETHFFVGRKWMKIHTQCKSAFFAGISHTFLGPIQCKNALIAGHFSILDMGPQWNMFCRDFCAFLKISPKWIQVGFQKVQKGCKDFPRNLSFSSFIKTKDFLITIQ